MTAIRKHLSFRQKSIISAFIIFFTAAIPFWLFVAGPLILRLPPDFTYTADLISQDNFYDINDQRFIGKAQTNSKFTYQVESVNPGIYIIQNNFSIESLSGEKIIDIKRLYGIDPSTRKHIKGFGDHDRTGYLFAPQHLQPGDDFTYWHVNYDAPAELYYKNTENIEGLRTFHYQAALHPDQTADLGYLPNVGETQGVNLDVLLDVWIEPISGSLVKYSDHAVGYYYDLGSGQRIAPWNSFSNIYTDESVINQVEQARLESTLVQVVQYIIPLLLAGFVVILVVPLLMNNFIQFDWFVRRSLAVIVIVIGVGLSLTTWLVSRTLLERQAYIAFQADVNTTINQITDRLELYRSALAGGESLFMAATDVTRQEWKEYISGLNLRTNYPGMQGMGYSEVVSPEQKQAFIDAMQTDGMIDFLIVPEGDREKYVLTKYIEPADERNQRVFGFDAFSDSTRREVLEKARDLGAATASGKVTLVQETDENIQAGFLIAIPYYGHTPVYTLEERRRNHIGYVYGVFRVDDLMGGIFTNSLPLVVLKINDAEIRDAVEGQMYDSVNHITETPTADALTTTRHLYVFGHEWIVHTTQLPTKQYLNVAERALPWVALVTGCVISILIGLLLYFAERGYLNFRIQKKQKSTT